MVFANERHSEIPLQRISNYTVNSFRLTVGLRMIGCAHLQLASQTIKYLLEKRSCKSGMRRSEIIDLLIESMMWFRRCGSGTRALHLQPAPILDSVGIK